MGVHETAPAGPHEHFPHPQGCPTSSGREQMRKTVAFPVILTACGALVACLLWAQPAAAQQKLTYPDLVKRLTDLERLSTLPDVGEKCQQWSSYDRGSKYDEKTGKYVGWAANGDGDGIIRKEGELSVFA